MNTTLSKKLKTAQNTLAAGQVQQAIDQLNALHVECHTEALIHMRTHTTLANAHRQNGNYRRAGFELLAIPFAGPASLAHKHFGVARKNL